MKNDFQFFTNPYKMIMMECPATGKVVATGINSLYFEQWEDNPPADGASFICSACKQKHTFDRRNTWLDELNPSKRSGNNPMKTARSDTVKSDKKTTTDRQKSLQRAMPVSETTPESNKEPSVSEGVPRMPRRFTAREKFGDGLYLYLQLTSSILFILLGIVGYYFLEIKGVFIFAFGGWLIGCWMRRSMGLRGGNKDLGFFVRQRERANGARRGILEWVIETIRGNAFTREKSQAITLAYDSATEKMKRSSSLKEQEEVLKWLDRKVKEISYD